MVRFITAHTRVPNATQRWALPGLAMSARLCSVLIISLVTFGGIAAAHVQPWCSWLSHLSNSLGAALQPLSAHRRSPVQSRMGAAYYSLHFVASTVCLGFNLPSTAAPMYDATAQVQHHGSASKKERNKGIDSVSPGLEPAHNRHVPACIQAPTNRRVDQEETNMQP